MEKIFPGKNPCLHRAGAQWSAPCAAGAPSESKLGFLENVQLLKLTRRLVFALVVSPLACGSSSGGVAGTEDAGVPPPALPGEAGVTENDASRAAEAGGAGTDAGMDPVWADAGGDDASGGVDDSSAADSSEASAQAADALADADATASDAHASDPHAVDVYLIGGQSNATGQGYVRNLPVGFQVDTAVRLFASGPPHLNSGAAPDTWIPLQHASESPDRFGPELGFGNTIHPLYPGHRIALVKHAHSGTNLFADWAPGASATARTGWGPQFATFVDTVDTGLAALRTQGDHPVLRAMVWQQGENDALTVANANAYAANLTAFIARVREQFGAPGMLFVYGYVLPPPNVAPGRDIVRLAEHDLDEGSGTPRAVTGAFVVATDDLEQRAADPGTPLPNDHLHFGSAGQLELGRRLATKVHDHLPLP